MIYKHLFDNTRVTFGYCRLKTRKYRQVLPSPHALAILRACRQTYQEAGDLWLSRILFSFEDNMTLLDKLSLLPIEILGQIKHVRTRIRMDEPYQPASVEIGGNTIAHKLMLLPGLDLDTLTISRGTCPFDHGYQGIPPFLQTSTFFKELHQITPGSPFHIGDYPDPLSAQFSFEVNLMTWERLIKKRTDAIQFTVSISQSSSDIDNGSTGSVYRQSASEILAETAISSNSIESIPRDKIRSISEELKPSAETLVVFKPSFPIATASILDTGSENEEKIPQVWRGVIRDAYIENMMLTEDITSNHMAAGDMFPWPYEMEAEYTIIDEYSDRDEVDWHESE